MDSGERTTQTEAKPERDKKQEEQRIIRKLSLVGIVGNVILSAFKLFAGFYGKSTAMISDAVHSLSDVFATGIAYIGVKMAKKEPDEEHPYGHERMECVASLILGLILLGTGLAIGRVGIRNMIPGSGEASGTTPRVIALAAALISIAVKEGMYRYTRHYAQKLNSAAFMADAWHHRSDALSSVGSLAGIGGAMLGFPIFDAAASVVICAFILKVAMEILRDALNGMTDTSCGEAYDKKVSDFVSVQEEVLGVDVLRSRKFGSKVYLDLEIEMDGERSLRETHEIVEQIHDKIERNFPSVKHVMIHVNPAH